MVKNATQSLFSDACRIKDFTLKLYDKKSEKEIELKDFEVKEGEICYGGFVIHSWFVIAGAADFQTHLKLTEDAGFMPFILDIAERHYRRSFHLTKYSKKDNRHSSLITIYGQDEVSFILSKLHISKTYKNKKLSDIFQDIFDTHVKPRLKYNKIEIDAKTEIEIENFVVTPQKSVLSFIQEEADRQGLNFFQDKTKIVMKSYKEFKPNSLESSGITYNNLKINPNSPFDILSFKFKNSDSSIYIPKSQVLAYDKTSKKIKIMKQNLEDIGFDVPEEAQNEKDGFEYVTQEYLYDDNIFAETYKSFLEVNAVDIIVPGNVEDIKLFNKYKLSFKVESDSVNEYVGNMKNSGDYILTGYVEKITAQIFYILKLSMSRFKTEDN